MSLLRDDMEKTLREFVPEAIIFANSNGRMTVVSDTSGVTPRSWFRVTSHKFVPNSVECHSKEVALEYWQKAQDLPPLTKAEKLAKVS